MARQYTVYIDPFANEAESQATSNPIDTRYAFDVTVSLRTDSGKTSTLTYQISNDKNVPNSAGVAAASWSDYTSTGSFDAPTSGATTIDLPLGYRWGRWIREVPASASSASWQIDMNLLFR